MFLTNFISILSSFKKTIFDDSFLFVEEDHNFHKTTLTNATLKITVNKKLYGFQAMQWIKSENEVIAVED